MNRDDLLNRLLRWTNTLQDVILIGFDCLLSWVLFMLFNWNSTNSLFEVAASVFIAVGMSSGIMLPFVVWWRRWRLLPVFIIPAVAIITVGVVMSLIACFYLV